MGIFDSLFYSIMKEHSSVNGHLSILLFVASASILAIGCGTIVFSSIKKNSSEFKIDLKSAIVIVCLILSTLLTCLAMFSASNAYHINSKASLAHKSYDKIIIKTSKDTIRFKIDGQSDDLVLKYDGKEMISSDSKLYHFIEDVSGQRGFEYVNYVKKLQNDDYEASYKCRCGSVKTLRMSEDVQFVE